jgi:predicted DNA-binding transcriptional regulator
LEKDVIESQLKGNTLRVYIYALKKRKVGVREVQRALRMSNPSLAQYHLSKLLEMGLLRENAGEYEVVSEVKVDVMKEFLRIGTLLVPRFVFYGAFFTVFAVYFGILSISSYYDQPLLVWPTALVIIGSAIFWYEAIRAWRSVPQT